MKFLFAFLFLLMLAFNMLGQDTIVKMNGERVICKVTEINMSEVKYKKQMNEGIVYSELKVNVKLIIFANGVKEHFDEFVLESPNGNQTGMMFEGKTYIKNERLKPLGKTRWLYDNKYISGRALLRILNQPQDPEINSLVIIAKRKRVQKFLGFAALPLAAAAIGLAGEAETVKDNNTRNLYYTSISACGVLAVGVLVLDITAGYKKRKAVNKAVMLYNQKY